MNNVAMTVRGDKRVIEVDGSFGISEREAHAFVAQLAYRIGDYALSIPGSPSPPRIVTGYVVERYQGTRLFGVIERWVYADKPALGEFGGSFIPLETARALAKDRRAIAGTG